MAPTIKRPRPARPINKPTSKIVIDQDLSLELVRTVMTATISTIAWCRKIFPHDRYSMRVYDYANPETSYESFMSGTHGKDFNFDRSDDVLTWRVLIRGSDSGVDKLLDWIELGVTDALERKFLAKLQLSFHTSDGAEVDDSNLIEAHIMTITYENGVPKVATETKTAKKHLSNSILLRSAKEELHGIIRNVAWLTQDLDELPVHRRMNMKLMYNDTCPSDYEPPGFRTCVEKDSSILIGNRGTHAGTMRTGFHSVSVKVIQQNPVGVTESQAQNKQATLDVARNNEDDGSSTTPKQTFTTAARMHSGLQHGPSESDIHGSHTQEEGVKLFRSMGAARDPNADTQDTVPLHGHPSPMVQARPKGEHTSDSLRPPGFQPYSQAVRDRIRAREEHTHIRSDDLDEPRESGPSLTCECRASDDDDILIQCALCDNFQHIQCYGCVEITYLRKHVCYTCLLETEDELLLEMYPLCVKRRTLYYLREKGVLTAIDDLAAYLSRDQETTVKLLDELKREGFLKAVPRTKKGKGKGLYSFVTNDAKLRSEYFHPELLIAHHFTIPDASLPGNTMVDDSINESSRPGQNNLTTQHYSYRTPSAHTRRSLHNMNESQMASLGEGSSTQGTLSPEVDAHRSSKLHRHNPDHDLRSYYEEETSTPSKYFLASQGNENSVSSSDVSQIPAPGELNGAGGMGTRQKRAVGTADEVQPTKRARFSSVNSPWASHRADS